MNYFVTILRIVAKPLTVLVSLWWFRQEVSALMTALANYVGRLRSLKGTMGSASIEAEAREEIDEVRQLERPPIEPIAKGTVPDVVEAKRFILRDSSGRYRAELGLVNEEKGTGLILVNSSGDRQMLLGCTQKRAFLTAEGKEGIAIVSTGGEVGALFHATGPDRETEPGSFLTRDFLAVDRLEVRKPS